MLELPLQSLLDEYDPPHFSRVGLRYVDVVKRSDVGLENNEWSTLLQPHLLGALGSEVVADRITELSGTFEVKLADDMSSVRVVLRLARDAASDEEVFVIDSDFYRLDRIPIGGVNELLEFFQERASRLIQWCITPTLQEAMQPQDL